MQWEPKWVASRTPDQDSGGSGGRQRSGPTGGCAYGIPRHSLSEPLATPWTVPEVVVTRRGEEPRTADGPVAPSRAATASSAPNRRRGVAKRLPARSRDVAESIAWASKMARRATETMQNLLGRRRA